MSLSNARYESSYETQTGAQTEPPVPAWKMELNAKLAAHRQRRPGSAEAENVVSQGNTERPQDGRERAALVAARVAERYAKAPTYSEFLAASAAAAAAAAETAALAARQAQDAAEVMARFAEAGERERAWRTEPGAEDKGGGSGPEASLPAVVERRVAVVGVEHPEPLPLRGIVPPRSLWGDAGFEGEAGRIVDAVAEATVPAAIGLPAKLIEFPRELIAARKSRPRIAEGPLVEVAAALPAEEPSALRIFEVGGVAAESAAEVCSGSWDGAAQDERGAEAREGGSKGTAAQGDLEEAAGSAWFGSSMQDARTSYSPQVGRVAPMAEGPRHVEPEWQPIRLGEHPRGEQAAEDGDPLGDGAMPGKPLLHTASLGDRAMAALVDGAVVTAAFLLFVLVFAACTAHPPVSKLAFAGAAAVLMALFLFYEWLFLSYGGGTPGMRYARIAVCTFDDENPTRRMLQRRLGASVLSALPLGLGFVWAVFDEDSLGWHDRMTRSYQRSYR